MTLCFSRDNDVIDVIDVIEDVSGNEDGLRVLK